MPSDERYLTGLIGENLSASLSPALHDGAYAALGLAGHYHAMDLSALPTSLTRAVASARALGFRGFGVTHPYKETVIPLLDETDAAAAEMGAVNTVVLRSDPATKVLSLRGYNTDWEGAAVALSALLRADTVGEDEVRRRLSRVVVVGAGGAARACVYALLCSRIGSGRALLPASAQHITVHDAELGRAEALVAHFAALAARAGCQLTCVAAVDPSELSACSGVINATPVGMHGLAGTPLPLDGADPPRWDALELLRAQAAWVFDCVYAAHPSGVLTQLVRGAQDMGLDAAGGAAMLLTQALRQFELMNGLAPDAKAMERHLQQLIDRSAAAAPASVVPAPATLPSCLSVRSRL